MVWRDLGWFGGVRGGFGVVWDGFGWLKGVVIVLLVVMVA